MHRQIHPVARFMLLARSTGATIAIPDCRSPAFRRYRKLEYRRGNGCAHRGIPVPPPLGARVMQSECAIAKTFSSCQ
jgi:hypothetical protein